jgi:hypothetical protein
MPSTNISEIVNKIINKSALAYVYVRCGLLLMEYK